MEFENKSVRKIAVILKRNVVKEDEYYSSFNFDVIDTKLGYESIDEFGCPVFITDDGKKYDLMSSDSSIASRDVYGFTADCEGKSDEEIKNMLKSIDGLSKYVDENYIIGQIYSSIDESITTWYAHFDNPESNITIDPSNISSLDSVDSIIMDGITTTNNLIIGINNEDKKDTSSPVIIYSDDIFNRVTKTVICQDEAVKSISTIIANNFRIANPKLKENILLCGPTGVGKTEIFRSISKNFNIPLVNEDSTTYTVSGYEGDSVISMLQHLYINAGRNISAAQRGIVFIDEFDKKASLKSDSTISSSGVIDSLLKMIEGGVYHFKDGANQVEIDTSLITFVLAGAYSEIDEEQKKAQKPKIGFGSVSEIKEARDYYTIEAIKKYGVKPEMLGRTELVVLNHLSKDDLKRIIIESDDSLLVLNKQLFQGLGIKMLYGDDFIDAVARKAEDMKLGARSIKSILSKALSDAKFHALSSAKYSELIIDSEIVSDPKKYILR